ncbi:Adhesive plaque matrix protein [Balamuthia mandrillaris]
MEYLASKWYVTPGGGGSPPFQPFAHPSSTTSNVVKHLSVVPVPNSPLSHSLIFLSSQCRKDELSCRKPMRNQQLVNKALRWEAIRTRSKLFANSVASRVLHHASCSLLSALSSLPSALSFLLFSHLLSPLSSRLPSPPVSCLLPSPVFRLLCPSHLSPLPSPLSSRLSSPIFPLRSPVSSCLPPRDLSVSELLFSLFSFVYCLTPLLTTITFSFLSFFLLSASLLFFLIIIN